MFKQKTVFIVGAGAGCEYNMPLGSALASVIAQNVRFRFDHYQHTPKSGDAELYNILFRLHQQDRETLNAYSRAGNSLAAAILSSISIDDALFQLSETPEAVILGKVAIVRAILSAERNSSLALSANNRLLDENSGRDGWIEQFFSMAIADVKRSDFHLAFKNVTFINFNYDRCIEHYLFWSLLRLGVSEPDAWSIVDGLNMIRPYGSIGPINQSAAGFVPYGGSADAFKAKDRIRTYTESEALHDGDELEKAMSEAKLIVFLGFGFHPQNMKLLELTERTGRRVMATIKKVHPDNKPDISTQIVAKLRCADSTSVELFDMTAPEMLRDLRLKILSRVS